MSDQIQVEISQSIKALRDSHDSLKEIVKHCTTINQNQGNREQALLETKNYALQALSSVAYQVNLAASKFEELLSWQQGEVETISAEMNTVYNGVGFSGEAASTSILSDVGLKYSKIANAPKTTKLPDRAFHIEDKSNLRIDYRLLDNVGIGQREFMSSAPAAVPTPAPPVGAPVGAPAEPGLTRTSTSSSAILSFKKPTPSSAPRPPTVAGMPSISVPRAPSVYSNADTSSISSFDAPPPAAPVGLPPPPPPPEVSQVNVSVIYDYQAQNPDELTVRAGEIILVLNPDAGGGWMEGRNSAGQSGIFPQSYVEII